MRAKAKLIVSLIKRIEVRLPINNTETTIETLEQDALIQQSVAAVIELSIYKLSVVVNQLALVLEIISKDVQPSTTKDAHVPLDVLQSQLFIIRLLSACLQYYWTWYKKHLSKVSKEANDTDEAFAAAAATGPYLNSCSIRSIEETAFDPPPLDEALVSFLLTLLGRFLNQYHVLEERSDQLLMSASEHTNETVANASKVDSQTMEYIREVYSSSGKILRYISASNWNSFHHKVKNAVNILVAANENSELNPPEIRILAFTNLNSFKLHTILTEFSPYFLNMKIQGKLLFAKMLRVAIWKWIETRPAEFSELFADTKKPLTGSEILFDMCNIAADSSRKKAVLWPLQTILLTLSPDLLVQAFLNDRGLQNRRTGFHRQLRKALESARTQEIAATCYVDLCRAASFVSPNDDTILRHIAEDVEDVLREKVWDFSRSSAADALSSSLGYTISQQTLVSNYLLSQLRLNPSRAIQAHIPSLLEDDAPTVFRQAFINACLAIVSEDHPLPWHLTLNSMYEAICTPLRRIFIQTVKIELSSKIEVSSISSNPRRTMSIDKRLQNTGPLLQSMLKLFRLDPCSALMGVDDKSRVEENVLLMNSLTSLIKHQDKNVRKAAIGCLTKLHDPSIILHWGPSKTIMSTFWKISSHAILSISRQILDNSRQSEESIRALFDLLANILDSRNCFLVDALETYPVQDPNDFHERYQAMVALEVALLVSLCSPIPDICSKSVKCLGYICKESKILDDENTFGDSTSRSSQSTLVYNYNIEIYERLCAEEPEIKGLKKQLFVGRKAQQKRLRKYMRMMISPTPSNLLAWEEVWKRWKVLTQVVIRYGMDTLHDLSDTSTIYSTSTSVKKIGGLVRHDKLRVSAVKVSGSSMSGTLPSPVPVGRVEIDDEKQTEWQNYTGFLAALGGCRLAADIDNDSISERSKSERSGSPASKSTALIERFITEMVELLTSENVVVREAVKDTLGNGLSPSLYTILFHQIETTLSNCFGSNGEIACNSTNTLFVEQSVLVLKMTLDRLINASDCLVSVDFSTIVLYFVNYINRLPHDNYTTMRTMIMMCHLTEALMTKMDQIIIRDDVRVKNRLLEIIIEWTSNFNQSKSEIGTLQNKEVQRDLDQICLKAIVALLHKLPLQISEQSRDMDKAMSKSRLFQKYFTFFIGLLERCHQYEAESIYSSAKQGLSASNLVSRYSFPVKPVDTYWGPLKESAVNALSNLLNANVEVGLRFTLAMGYHEDSKMRNSCMQVLSNILNAGARFDTLADTIVNDRYKKLVEILVESDMEVTLSVCDVCPASDASSIASVLLSVFESKNKLLPVLKAIIEREVFSADQESTLFRGTNMATRMLSTFARNTCVEYVKITIQSAMESINALSDEQLTWEMDPVKETSPEKTNQNKQNVCRVADMLMDAICNSIPNAPSIFRKELSFLVEAVNKRFPDAAETQVGGFVFLRLFNPAILTPENSGVSKRAIPRSKNVRKILLQATRLIQNLANNVMFGAKEPHMISLNDFITNNLYRVTHFLREISIAPTQTQETRSIRLETAAHAKLHKYLSENLEKISRHVSGPRSHASSDTEKILELKRTMERFSNILGQLGPPPDIAQEESTMTRNYAITSSNSILNDYMRRNRNRDLSSIQSLNMIYQGGVSRKGYPVFYFITRCLAETRVDFELLVYFWIRTLEPYLNQPFELIFDLSGFHEGCVLPVYWFNQFVSLIKNEIDNYLASFHIFNPNFYMQHYVHSLPRDTISKLTKCLTFSRTIDELAQNIAPSEIRLPKDTCDIEKEIGMTIKNAVFLDNYKTAVPVEVKIGKEYFQVTTLQEREVFITARTILNNVYSMNDLSSISLPSIFTGKKGSNEGEIMVTVNNGKSTMLLVVPNREEVYNYLLKCKKTFETNNTEDKDSIRPKDVPGRILNMALLNMGSEDHNLRLSSYGLLCSISIYFRFKISTTTIHSKDIFIPYNDSGFIVSISESIASGEPHLTLEFLSECIVGLEKSNTDISRQILSLEYMVPWLKNITLFIHGPNGDGGQKIKEIMRSLVALTAKKPELQGYIQEKIWKTFVEMEEIHALAMECLIQFSVEHGLGSHESEISANILVTMNCNSIRGKIITRVRKALQSTSQNCRSSLVKHPAWVEIACLVRIMIALSFYYVSSSKPFVAESFHIVALLTSTGPTFIRSSVHGFLVNAIHILVTSDHVSSNDRKKLKYLMDDVGDGKYRVHFGLNKSYANAFTITDETMSDDMENISLASLEIIVQLLLDVTAAAASSYDVANAWRARWMGLATSMTFQFNPALQPRSFVILGCLAQEDIDDDLMFQILIVLRNDLAHFDEKNSELVISILMCLKNIVNNLSASSRYLKSMFWLAISMIQMNHSTIFPHAVNLLRASLRNMDAQKLFDQKSIQDVMMDVRAPFVSILLDIDAAAGVSFDTQFSFAIAGSLLRGFQFADSREIILDCLSAFLEIEAKNECKPKRIVARCLGYFIGLLPFSAKNDSIHELLHMTGLTDTDFENIATSSDVHSAIWQAIDIPDNTTGILLVSFLVGMLSVAENELERLFLFGILSKAAASKPEVFALVYESIIPKMSAIVVTSNNTVLIDAVKKILVTACSDPAFSSVERSNQQKRYLENIGFNAFGDPNFGKDTSISVSARLTSELLRMICE